MNREDSVLDEIDRLVDESLARGDRSDSFHGEQYREEQPCPWCVEGYHYLPITQRMWEMRQGSYARDEFGYGIMDPDYRFEDDDSPVLCPGSEYHGPVELIGGWKVWGKQSRERVKAQSARTSRAYDPPGPSPSLPPGRIRRLRFHGPFTRWIVALDDDRIIEDLISDPASVGLPGPRRRIPTVVEQRLTCTFTPELDIRNPSREWLEQNIQDVVDQEIRMTAEGTFVTMSPVVIPFRSFVVHADSPTATEPDWFELETSYRIEQHPWFCEFWIMSGTADEIFLRPHGSTTTAPGRQGHEPDYVIIDEAYEMTNERLRQHVEDARSGSTTQEASDQAQR